MTLRVHDPYFRNGKWPLDEITSNQRVKFATAEIHSSVVEVNEF